MSNQTVTANSITVHGRGSLILPFRLNNDQGSQTDISGWPLYFEIDGIPIRERLQPDPGNPLGQVIVLERAQVEMLSKQPYDFALIDERQAAADIFTVLWTGKISRTGYKGAPDGVAGV